MIAVGLTDHTPQFTQVYGSSVDFQRADGRHKMSLELRVKEKLLRYPEEVFCDSQGIPEKLLSSCLIMLVLG